MPSPGQERLAEAARGTPVRRSQCHDHVRPIRDRPLALTPGRGGGRGYRTHRQSQYRAWLLASVVAVMPDLPCSQSSFPAARATTPSWWPRTPTILGHLGTRTAAAVGAVCPGRPQAAAGTRREARRHGYHPAHAGL
jgi:hypothetical protein